MIGKLGKGKLFIDGKFIGKGKLFIDGKFIGNVEEIETKCSKTDKEKK